MSDFATIIVDSIRDGSCLLLVLSNPRASSAAGPEKMTLRPVSIKGHLKYQMTLQQAGQHSHENLDTAQALTCVKHSIANEFRRCHLFTAEADYVARVKQNGAIKFKKSPPSKQDGLRDHDRKKNYLIPDNVPCAFLIETGLMTQAGKVRASKYHKFRQINRFLELVNDVLPHLPQNRPLNVVDFGCGKSYLTFAVYHLLTAIHHRRVSALGLDRRADVIRECQRIAERCGYGDLEFRVGDLAQHDAHLPVDMAVSLHACDTATDAALAKAVAWQTPVILAVPCCQHELVEKIAGNFLRPIGQHGILRERFAALATDALRAQALEICGYRTQVVEFIDLEHTAKNVLIRAIRIKGTSGDVSQKVAAFCQLKQELGLKRLYLEEVLGDEFTALVNTQAVS